MRTCVAAGRRVRLSLSGNPNRKLKFTLEQIFNGKCWIGVNTILANRIVSEAVENKQVPELTGYLELKREYPMGKNSRVDIYLKGKKKPCYVEVKNVTLRENGHYQFPDSVTERGTKHLRELALQVKRGNRAVMFFLIQRSDAKGFCPAGHIDPVYSRTLGEVKKKGVEIIAYKAKLSQTGITLGKPETVLI